MPHDAARSRNYVQCSRFSKNCGAVKKCMESGISLNQIFIVTLNIFRLRFCMLTMMKRIENYVHVHFYHNSIQLENLMIHSIDRDRQWFVAVYYQMVKIDKDIAWIQYRLSSLLCSMCNLMHSTILFAADSTSYPLASAGSFSCNVCTHALQILIMNSLNQKSMYAITRGHLHLRGCGGG